MRTLTTLAVVVVLLAAGAVSQERRPQDVALQAAIRTETVDGNLESAIKQFGDIAEKYKSDRTTAATALLHLAGVYQKRGDTQATAVYERIVREFAEQKETVAIARARLGRNGGTETASMVYRRVWSDPGANEDGTTGTVSPDGRYLSYVDWTGGDLMVRDLAMGTSRRLTGNGSWPLSNEYAEQSAIARDGTQLAYAWFNGKDRYQLRVLSLSSGTAPPRIVLDQPDVEWLAPHDWSPDGRSVVVVLNRTNRRTEVAVVGVEDHSLRTILPTDWSGPARTAFSPDGRFVAFDRAVGARVDEERDICVVRVSDGTQTEVAPNPGLERFVAWSPDGKSLLFSSDRGGRLGLWSQSMNEGRPMSRQPDLLKSDIGERSMGITTRGSLYVGHQVAGRDIYIAEVDFTTGTVVKAAERATDRFVGMSEWPDWSRDGKFLSYVYARNWMGRNPTIAIRSLESGDVREVPLAVINGRNPYWSPDGQAFVTQGVGADGQRGIYRVDARDGAVTSLVQGNADEFLSHPQFSPDGRKLYFGRFAEGQVSVVELNVESGQQRDVFRRPGLTPGSVSPDGRSLATIQRGKGTSAALVASLVAPGEPTEVLRVNHPQVLTGYVSWAPGGRALIMNTFWNDGARRETWLVPIDGGPHRTLDLPGHTWGPIRVHPDGKRVAYHAGDLKSEVWVLENFLPAPTTAKRRD